MADQTFRVPILGDDGRLPDKYTPQQVVDIGNTDFTASAASLPAGSAPTVAVTGDMPNKTLVFGIPAGDKGDPGIQGDPGPVGTVSANSGMTFQSSQNAAVLSSNLASDLSQWTLAGGATYTVGTGIVLGSTGTMSKNITANSGQIVQIDITNSGDNGNPIIASLGSVSNSPSSWGARFSHSLVAGTGGSQNLTISSSGWSGTITGINVRTVNSPRAKTTSNPSLWPEVNGNQAIGGSAQQALTTGVRNQAIGDSAQLALTTGSWNQAIGGSAQRALTTGVRNQAIGDSAQLALTTGSWNQAIGDSAQRALTTGNWNQAIGDSAQRALTTGVNNQAIGDSAQLALTTGSWNQAIGDSAQRALTTGSWNQAIGGSAGYQPNGNQAWATTSGSYQVLLGDQTGQGSATQVDEIVAIGRQATVLNAGSVAIGAHTASDRSSQVAVGTRDIEVQDSVHGVVLRSPDGGKWRLTIGNTGSLTTTKIN